MYILIPEGTNVTVLDERTRVRKSSICVGYPVKMAVANNGLATVYCTVNGRTSVKIYDIATGIFKFTAA